MAEPLRSRNERMKTFPGQSAAMCKLALMVGLGVVVSGQTSSPPAGYRLDEVAIEVTRNGRPPAALRHARLTGKGTGEWKEGTGKVSFPFPPADMLVLINSLYAIHFFDLPASFSVRYSAYLRDDGTTGLKALKMHDAAHSILCFTAGGFKKCVTFGEGAPLELERLVAQILADTRKRTAGKRR